MLPPLATINCLQTGYNLLFWMVLESVGSEKTLVLPLSNFDDVHHFLF